MKAAQLAGQSTFGNNQQGCGLGFTGTASIGEVEVMVGAIESGILQVVLDDNAAIHPSSRSCYTHRVQPTTSTNSTPQKK